MSAVQVVQDMLTAGVQWSLVGNAVKLSSGRSIPPHVVQALNKNKAEVLRLVRKNPSPDQLAMLAELEQMNQQWDRILEREKQGFPGQTEQEVLDECAQVINSATDLYEAIREQNPALTEGVRCLYV